jgi:hypothetical protein
VQIHLGSFIQDLPHRYCLKGNDHLEKKGTVSAAPFLCLKSNLTIVEQYLLRHWNVLLDSDANSMFVGNARIGA